MSISLPPFESENFFSRDRFDRSVPREPLILHTQQAMKTRSTIVGGGGYNKVVPVLGGNGTKIAPTGFQII